jgi:hypothetical protein
LHESQREEGLEKLPEDQLAPTGHRPPTASVAAVPSPLCPFCTAARDQSGLVRHARGCWRAAMWKLYDQEAA